VLRGDCQQRFRIRQRMKRGLCLGNEKVFIELLPKEGASTVLDQFQGIEVNHPKLLPCCYCQQLRQISIRQQFPLALEVPLSAKHKLQGFWLLLGQPEGSHSPPREQLDQKLASEDKVDRRFQLSLADAGEDLLDDYLFVEGVVSQEVHLKVLPIAEYMRQY